LDSLQFKKRHSRCSESDQADATTQDFSSDGSTSPRTVAAVLDDLHQKLEDWVSAIEGRVCAVEQTLWSMSPGAQRHGSDLPPVESDAEVLRLTSLAMQKLHGNMNGQKSAGAAESGGKSLSCAAERDPARHFGTRLQSEIDDINTKLQELNMEVDSGGAVMAEGKSLADVKQELSTTKDSVKVLAARLELLQQDACSPCKKADEVSEERRQTRGCSVLSVASEGQGRIMKQVLPRKGISVGVRAASAVSAPNSLAPHPLPAQLQTCSEGAGFSCMRALPVSAGRTVQRRSSAPAFPPATLRCGVVSSPTSTHRQVLPNSHAMRFAPHQTQASAVPLARRQHLSVSSGINCWSLGPALH